MFWLPHETGAILEFYQEIGAVWLALLAGYLLGYKLRTHQLAFEIVWGCALVVYGGMITYSSVMGYFDTRHWTQPVPYIPQPGIIGWLEGLRHEQWEWIEGALAQWMALLGFLGAMLIGRRMGRWTPVHSALIVGALVVLVPEGLLRIPTTVKTFSEPANIASPYQPDQPAPCPMLVWVTPPPGPQNLPPGCYGPEHGYYVPPEGAEIHPLGGQTVTESTR